jgi:hypothetical protein
VFAAIFEVQPKQGKFDEYLSLEKLLRLKLEAIDHHKGFWTWKASRSGVYRDKTSTS